MSEFETELLSLLCDIRDELQVSSVPENLRRNQREVIAITRAQKEYDTLIEYYEERINSHSEKLCEQYPETPYEDLLNVDETLRRLDKLSKDITTKWKANEERLEVLCKRGCYHPEFIYRV